MHATLRTPIVLTALAAAALATPPAAAQITDRTPPSAVPVWKQLGPMPGAGPYSRSMVAPALRPNQILAATSAGLMRSDDRGETWTRQCEWPEQYGTFPHMDVSPTDPDRIAIARFRRGVRVTHDGGASWRRPSVPPTADVTYRATFDPVDPDVVYVTCNDGLWRSGDGGDTFVRIVEAAAYGASAWTDRLLVDRNNRNHLFVILNNEGILASEDAGATWELRPFPAGINYPLGHAIDPRDGRRLILAANDVHLSEDGGRTWSLIHTAPNLVDSVAFDPIDPDRILLGERGLGLTYTEDGGLTWIQSTDPGLDAMGGNPAVILASVAHPGDVVVSGLGGFARSTDGGLTFHRTNGGLDQYAYTTSVAVDAVDPMRLVARTGGSAFYSTDGGASWTESVSGPAFAGEDVVADPVVGGRFYAGGYNNKLWRSDDGGVSFAPVFVDPVVYFWHLDPHPTDANVLYGAGRGVLRSVDGGVTFTNLGLPSSWVWDVAVAPSDPNVLYASTASTVYHSRDAGATWTVATTPPAAIVRDLEVDPLDPNRAWASVPLDGLFRTVDGGVTWDPVPSSAELTQAAHVPRSNPGLLLTCDARLWTPLASRNGGLTNVPFAFGLGSVVKSYASTTTETYAATLGGGVFVLR